MYLKSLIIKNYRKFGEENNKVSFIDSRTYNQNKAIVIPLSSETTQDSEATQENKAINISTTATLIVGKNNAGKSTITSILDKMINIPSTFGAFDFNMKYLKGNLAKLKENPDDYNAPSIEVKIIIGLDDDSEDLVTNYVPFISLDSLDNSEIEISVKYEVKEAQEFKEKMLNVISTYETFGEEVILTKYLEVINESKFDLTYYDVNGDKVVNFKIGDLIELKPVKAIKVKNESSLSDAFCKIIKYRYKEKIKEDERINLDKKIVKMNVDLDGIIKEKHSNDINKSLGKITSMEKLNVLLRSDLSFSRLFKDLIKYEYIDGDNRIPENQFGLGYTNMVTIIAELIDYMEHYGDSAFNSKVNLISIEEPETYMHPQMQEVFINNINEAVEFLLESRNKNINTQLIITTHSSHILNSTIHNGNSFDNINYITSKKGYANAVVLTDKIINPSQETDIDDLKFLKKHIKFKASDLFFADAVIFVEGITEETYLKNHIENDPELSKYYITIFNIDGAHGLVYHNLIKLLKIPCLVITDLDIWRSDEEKENYIQIDSLNDRKTTNKTICKYNTEKEKLDNICLNTEIDNLCIAYQLKVNDYYPTSFEEALILENYTNNILKKTLKDTKPQIYKDVIGTDRKEENIKTSSYKLQVKLSNSKSDFANTLLFNIINKNKTDDDLFVPKYIQEGLKWLQCKIKENN